MTDEHSNLRGHLLQGQPMRCADSSYGWWGAVLEVFDEGSLHIGIDLAGFNHHAQ